MSRLTREIKGFSGDSGERPEANSDPAEVDALRLIEPDELHASTRP